MKNAIWTTLIAVSFACMFAGTGALIGSLMLSFNAHAWLAGIVLGGGLYAVAFRAMLLAERFV